MGGFVSVAGKRHVFHRNDQIAGKDHLFDLAHFDKALAFDAVVSDGRGDMPEMADLFETVEMLASALRTMLCDVKSERLTSYAARFLLMSFSLSCLLHESYRTIRVAVQALILRLFDISSRRNKASAPTAYARLVMVNPFCSIRIITTNETMSSEKLRLNW